MRKPAQNVVHALHSRPRGQLRPRDHDDRQPKLARGIDLGARPRAAGVARHDPFDSPRAHHLQFPGARERSARHDDLAVRERQRDVGSIDESQRIGVLWLGGEASDVLPADGQEHARTLDRQGENRRSNIGNVDPAIAMHFDPWRPLERDQRRVGRRTSGNRVAADLGCKGVRRIDHMGDFFTVDICGKSIRAAETAGTGRQWLIDRHLRPSGIGIDRIEPCGGKRGCQLVGLARSAQNEGVCHA